MFTRTHLRVGLIVAVAGFLVVSGELHAQSLFRRGDANGDGSINLADAIVELSFLFDGGGSSCHDAMDANDDGAINVADAIFTLTYLFNGGSPPPSPSECGCDPTPDDLDCQGPVSSCAPSEQEVYGRVELENGTPVEAVEVRFEVGGNEFSVLTDGTGHFCAATSSGDVLLWPVSSMVDGAQLWAAGCEVEAGTGAGVEIGTIVLRPTVFFDAQARTWPVGVQAQAVVPGDFDDDGLIDLAIVVHDWSTPDDRDIVILANLGDNQFVRTGIFSVPVLWPLDFGYPRALVAGDLDGDAVLDLAIVGPNVGVAVLLGDGTGAFGEATLVSSITDSLSLALADLSGDGLLDIVIANDSTREVQVLLNDSSPGSPSFSEGAAIPHGAATGIVYLEAADFDGDEDLDVFVANSVNPTGREVGVLVNDGTSLPTLTSLLSTIGGTFRWQVEDLNGDGAADFVLFAPGVNSVIVPFLTDVPTGTLVVQPLVPTDVFDGVLLVGDSDGDGIPDLHLQGYRSRFRGIGDGTFLAEEFVTSPHHPPADYTSVCTDLSGDGKADFALPTKGLVATVISDEFGEFPNPIGTHDLHQPTALEAVDIDNDGDRDVMVIDDDNLKAWINDGVGNLTQDAVIGTGCDLAGIEIGDINADGFLDVVSMCINVGLSLETLQLFLGDGTGQFAAPVTVSSGLGGAVAFALGDLTGDGVPEIVVGGAIGSANPGMSVLLNDGTGAFPTCLSLPVAWFPNAIELADLDGDGDLDLVTSQTNWGSGGFIHAYENTSSGFEWSLLTTGGLLQPTILVQDLGGSTLPEIVIASRAQETDLGTLRLLQRAGTSYVVTDYPIRVGTDGGAFTAEDFNNDGHLDVLVTAGTNLSAELVFLSDGLGGLVSMGGYPDSCRTSVAGDLDGDDRPEIISVRYAAMRVLWSLP